MSRELPHSNEAEQSLLGAMMIYPSVAAIAYDQGLEAKDFYLDGYAGYQRCRKTD